MSRTRASDYIELRFSPLFMAQAHGLDPAGISAALAAGVQRGIAKAGLKANLIGILSRHFGPEKATGELQALLANRTISSPWTWPATKLPGHQQYHLPYEYEQATPKAGLILEQVHQTQRNAWQLAFLPEKDKLELLNKKMAVSLVKARR